MFFFKDQYLNVFVWFAWDIVTFYTGIFNHIIHAYKQNEKENECEPLYIFCMKLHQFPGKCMQSGRRITTYTTYASGMMLVGVSLLQLQDCLVRCTSYAMHLLGECMMRKYVFGGMKLMERWEDTQGDCWPDMTWNTQYATNERKVNGKAVFGRVLWNGRKICRENGKREGITFKWQIGI